MNAGDKKKQAEEDQDNLELLCDHLDSIQNLIESISELISDTSQEINIRRENGIFMYYKKKQSDDLDFEQHWKGYLFE